MLVDFPRPESTAKDNFYEDTMLLLQMVRDTKRKENREKKVQFLEKPRPNCHITKMPKTRKIIYHQEAKIRAMALEQKRRNAVFGKQREEM